MKTPNGESPRGAAADAFTPGLLGRLPRSPERVALLCASRIGDFLCATPAFRALRTALPGARFTLIGMPFVDELVQRSPYLDAFEPFPGFPGIAEQCFEARKAAGFFHRMQQMGFDLAVQLHGSGMYSNVAALMLGADRTAGFVRSHRHAGRLDAALTWPRRVHAAHRSLSLAVFLGAADTGQTVECPLLPSDRAAADRLLAGCEGPLIGIHAGSREPVKIWPAERFAEAGTRLHSLLGGTVVVLGGPDERSAGSRIASVIGPRARNLAGHATIPEMAAVIARLSVLVTTDSAPAHMAYALNVPSVTLFGTTDPREWGPPSRACHKVLRAPNRRLASLSVDDVVVTAREAAEAR